MGYANERTNEATNASQLIGQTATGGPGCGTRLFLLFLSLTRRSIGEFSCDLFCVSSSWTRVKAL